MNKLLYSTFKADSDSMYSHSLNNIKSWAESIWLQLKHACICSKEAFVGGSPGFLGDFCAAPEMRRTHLVHPIFLVLCGQIWSRCSFKPRWVSITGRSPSPISDLRTHCPRNSDQLVWSEWPSRSKWVRYKPISQALTVGGQAESIEQTR